MRTSPDISGGPEPCHRHGGQARLHHSHRRHHAFIEARQFDTGAQLLNATKLQTYTVPGEHDILEEDRKSYLNRYGKGTLGDGWYSFNAHGVHFIGLVNVVNLQGAGLGDLGKPQLEWLEKDVKSLSSSTPIVVIAHVPLWIVYQDWGWGTADGAQALTYLKRFGSVTVLNGHIHQVMQKVEGHVAFHTARSTAFPQGVPGVAKGSWADGGAAGRAEELSRHGEGQSCDSEEPLAIVDTPLAG
jgi:Icc protein